MIVFKGSKKKSEKKATSKSTKHRHKAQTHARFGRKSGAGQQGGALGLVSFRSLCGALAIFIGLRIVCLGIRAGGIDFVQRCNVCFHIKPSAMLATSAVSRCITLVIVTVICILFLLHGGCKSHKRIHQVVVVVVVVVVVAA